MRFQVDPDIRKASTISSEFYRDPAIWQDARTKIFAKSWQFIGDSDAVKVAGQLHPVTLFDEPILLTRDTDDVLHCISNVCTHRANIVIEAGGNERFLRCRYHGRRFGLDGKFQSMPEFEGVEGFPCDADDLARVPFGQWGKFLFASLEPQFSLEEFLQPMADRIGWMPLNLLNHEQSRSTEYLVRSHWALYCDNYLEGFHIPFIHSALNEAINYFDYDLKAGVPAGAQEANHVVAPADWAQPAGTRLIWQLSGPVDFLEPVTTSSTTCKVYALGASGRGEASVQLRYEFDLNSHTYSALDTSDGAKSQLSPHAVDTTYRQMSCHRPKELLDQVPSNKATVVQTYSPANPPTRPLETYGFVDRYGLRLWSWIGDPYPEVWVQERFPNGVPTQWADGHPFDPGVSFSWNGTTGGKWTTLIPPAIPGYTYSGNMHYDYIGYEPAKNGYTGGWHWGAKPLSGGTPVQTFVHDYYAATESTANGNSTGVFVGSYEAKCYTNATTHIKQ